MYNSSTSSKLSEQFLHPVVVGVLGYFGAHMAGDGNKVVTTFGMEQSLPSYIGLVTAASSLAGESLKQWVLPMLPNNQNYSSLESTFLQPGLTGLVDGTALFLLTGSRFMEGAVIGAASEIAGGYLYDGVIKPYIN